MQFDFGCDSVIDHPWWWNLKLNVIERTGKFAEILDAFLMGQLEWYELVSLHVRLINHCML